ncbi:MAG: 50S ribosomal protein L18 [Gemmataceae bacterium]
MDAQKLKKRRQLRRRRHVRSKVQGTPERPRLTVFRSSKHIYVQLVDDLGGKTLAAAGSNGKEIKASMPYGGNIKAAKAIGQLIAQKAKEKGIEKVAFDRGHYRYHGRVKALADAAREAGLQF